MTGERGPRTDGSRRPASVAGVGCYVAGPTAAVAAGTNRGDWSPENRLWQRGPSELPRPACAARPRRLPCRRCWLGRGGGYSGTRTMTTACRCSGGWRVATVSSTCGRTRPDGQVTVPPHLVASDTFASRTGVSHGDLMDRSSRSITMTMVTRIGVLLVTTTPCCCPWQRPTRSLRPRPRWGRQRRRRSTGRPRATPTRSWSCRRRGEERRTRP